MPWFSSQKDRISWQIFSKNGCDLPNYYVSLVWGLNTLRRRTVTGRPWLLRHVVLHISCHSDRGVQDQWRNDDGFSQQHGEVWRIFPSKLLETFFLLLGLDQETQVKPSNMWVCPKVGYIQYTIVYPECWITLLQADSSMWNTNNFLDHFPRTTIGFPHLFLCLP
jgi:hypothetical protein